MFWAVLIIVLVLWVLMNLKKSRSDGEFVAKLHPYRRMMQYIMPTRNESVVYFETFTPADKLLEYLDEAKVAFGANITHALVGACMIGLDKIPALNQFIVGRRVYRRKGRAITFSMKRKKLDRKAKLATVKEIIPDGESPTFRELVERINAKINVERSGKKTYADKEFDLFSFLPRPVMNLSVKLFRWLDYHNVLPGSFIANDPMYTSMFIANLGSVKMGAGFHHLYEWGNCPLFLMAGQIEERAVVKDGQVVAQKILHLRWTYDERIDDGMTARYGMDEVEYVIEHPYECLGGLDDAPSADAATDDAPETEEASTEAPESEPTSEA